MEQIKISEVLQFLEDGMSREEIAEKLGITMSDCKRMFRHPKLKGKKTKKQLPFELVDDLEELTQEATEPLEERDQVITADSSSQTDIQPQTVNDTNSDEVFSSGQTNTESSSNEQTEFSWAN